MSLCKGEELDCQCEKCGNRVDNLRVLTLENLSIKKKLCEGCFDYIRLLIGEGN